MLRILEQKNLEAYQDKIKQLAVPADIPLHLTEALDDHHEIQGYILYAYQPEAVSIYALDDHQDWNYCDGLVRSVLFKAQLKGIQKAVFMIQDTKMIERLVKLGFIKNNQNTLENIMEVMENCKKCKEKSANT